MTGKNFLSNKIDVRSISRIDTVIDIIKTPKENSLFSQIKVQFRNSPPRQLAAAARTEQHWRRCHGGFGVFISRCRSGGSAVVNNNTIFIIRSVRSSYSVSYTHLDVYKRQARSQPEFSESATQRKSTHTP